MDYGKYFNKPNEADEVAEMIARAGNRSERRKILKALNKTKNIEKYTNEIVSKEKNKELEEKSKQSFGYIMSMIGIILHDKYNWSDDDIGDLFSETSRRLEGEWSDNKSVEDVAAELMEKTGIELVVR